MLNLTESGDGRPLVVALGGGHGLASSLKSLVLAKVFPVGIVSVADDGGSSGRLRADFGFLPPGDLRKCLIALADSNSLWASAIDYRFSQGDLAGHSLGNLIISGLTEVSGDFSRAISEVAHLLGSKGLLFPSSVSPVTLVATAGGKEVRGQVQIMHTSGIDRLKVLPEDPEVPQGALEAISRANAIVVGPGSLFTSVLAVLCYPKIRDAISRSSAKRIYVSNLRPQMEETIGMTVADHVAALVEHGFYPDVVISDDSHIVLGEASELCGSIGCQLVNVLLSDGSGNLHSPELLSIALQDVI